MKILVVDDEELIRRTLARALAAHSVVTVESCAEARAEITNRMFDLVLSDLHLNDGSGTDLYDWICRQPVKPGCFALMSGSPPSTGDKSQLCIIDYPVLTKPFGRRDVLELLRQIEPTQSE